MSPSTILRHAAADADFRAELLTGAGHFGVPAAAVPTAVEQQDTASLGYWTEGVAAVDAYACASTCSSGPFTFACDGSTKN
ncbi:MULTISPECIES: cinnamycin family lantibiotic [Thermomonosporaceae]|uniref:cinnamycin family lantibiotic n=1 Tax=Thermomonosporaceae TaxID=2012 RepID=UPI00255B17AF|nr:MULTISPECIES: cinnamycin family lantibiotic [Thermomonosporaceae]MDL4773540.1 cinnamycin family lantibiotic [Actinomadura xylanilytica]